MKPDHHDMFDRKIEVGAFVACVLSSYKNLELCVVEKLNPKMVRLRRLNATKWGTYYTANKYPHEMIVITNQEDITMYVLRNSEK